MTYTKTAWKNGVTPVNDSRLNNLEKQYDTALADVGTVAPRFASGGFIWAGSKALNAFGIPTADDGSSNVIALGRGAMGSMTDCKVGIAIGRNAQGNSLISRDNIAIGEESLRNVSAGTADYNQGNQTGTRNVGIGGNALYFNASGFGNVAMGRNAGQSVVGGTGLVAIGTNANSGNGPIGFSGAIENGAPWGADGNVIYTTAIGNRALMTNLGLSNVGVGGWTLTNVKRSEGNTAVGAQALQSLDSGTGARGGLYTTLGIGGTYSQSGTVLTLTIPAHGLIVGDLAFMRLLDGGAQTFQSDLAFAYVDTVVDANTFTVTVPKSASAAGNATLAGKESAAQQPQNINNSAFGNLAGNAQAVGSNNTWVGQRAATAATGGDQNVAVGAYSLAQATNIGNSVAVGYYAAGNQATNSSRVTAVGASALRNRVDGTAMTDDWTNVSGFGYDSRVSGANQVALGNSSQTVYVQTAVQTRSDARDKADVRDTELGLDFIERLRPVDYRWDRREDYTVFDEEGNGVGLGERNGSKKRTRYHHGLIAQEVQRVIQETGVDFGGFQDHKVDGGSDVLTVGYEELIAPLIAAVQELSKKVQRLESGR